jgi:hypothetical protein
MAGLVAAGAPVSVLCITRDDNVRVVPSLVGVIKEPLLCESSDLCESLDVVALISAFNKEFWAIYKVPLHEGLFKEC